MDKIVAFAKHNWLSIILILVIVYLFGTSSRVTPYSTSTSNVEIGRSVGIASPMMAKGLGISAIDNYQQAAPTDAVQRMVVQDTALAMQVKDVSSVMSDIEKTASDLGGYLVNRSVSKPEGAASGNISIRVPAEKREIAISSIKKLGIKTVLENVNGHDVTDQYVDIQGRIGSLNKTKIKMETLMDQANAVQDLMSIQTQLNNIQSQIDNYLGQQKYLEQTAKLTRITVSLSTDELALPYSPDSAWRPGIVFKSAVRSMISTLRSVANSVIWLAVYLPVAALILVIYWFFKIVWKKFQPVR